jgi:hypothetical protein
MNLLSKPQVLLVLCCLVIALFWLSPQARADLIINEIMGDPNQDWDGSGEYNFRGDEWIEVMNDGETSEDLTSYWLRDTTGDEAHLQLHGTLQSGEVAIFFGSEAAAWQQLHGFSVTGLSINNSGDTIELLKTVPDEGGSTLVVVHSITILDHEAEDDRSSGWDSETGLWSMNDALNPYNGGSEPQGNDCQPSPGESNICVPLVPVQRTSWDALKSQYR